MATYRDRGIVLASKILRDADRHYTFLTEHHGKITVLAKGSRKSKSKMSPHLASFGVADLMIARGKIIDRLAGASLERPHKNIVASLEKSALAQSVFLTFDRLVKRDLPDERIYALAISFLETLNVIDVDRASGVTLYQAVVMKLLDALGHGFELSVCVRCRQQLVPDGNAFAPERGGIECRACRTPICVSVSGDAIKALRFLRGAAHADVARLRVAPSVRRELAALIDVMLSPHLDARSPGAAYLTAVL